MTDRAILSLQLGNYSNWVGAHYWNLQEAGFVYPSSASGASGDEEARASECSPDVLYREGVTLTRQPTFTPRLVASDLKGGLGALPELGDLYEAPCRGYEEALSDLWPGQSHVQKEEPARRSEYQRQLDREENGGDGEKDVCEAEAEAEAESGGAAGLYDLDGDVHFWSDYLRARCGRRKRIEGPKRFVLSQF